MSVAIHLMEASSYYTSPREDELKQHIKKVGATNVPLDFLRDTSMDKLILPCKNGKKMKATSLIKRKTHQLPQIVPHPL